MARLLYQNRPSVLGGHVYWRKGAYAVKLVLGNCEAGVSNPWGSI